MLHAPYHLKDTMLRHLQRSTVNKPKICASVNTTNIVNRPLVQMILISNKKAVLSQQNCAMLL